jgi:hypothetical protein
MDVSVVTATCLCLLTPPASARIVKSHGLTKITKQKRYGDSMAWMARRFAWIAWNGDGTACMAMARRWHGMAMARRWHGMAMAQRAWRWHGDDVNGMEWRWHSVHGDGTAMARRWHGMATAQRAWRWHGDDVNGMEWRWHSVHGNGVDGMAITAFTPPSPSAPQPRPHRFAITSLSEKDYKRF